MWIRIEKRIKKTLDYILKSWLRYAVTQALDKNHAIRLGSRGRAVSCLLGQRCFSGPGMAVQIDWFAIGDPVLQLG